MPEGLMVSSVVGVLGPLGDYSYFFSKDWENSD